MLPTSHVSLWIVAQLLLLVGSSCTVSADTPPSCNLVQENVETASRYSNLKAVKPISCSPLTPKQYRDKVRSLLERDTLAAQLPWEEVLLKRLGLIPDNYPYARCIYESIASVAAAFYTPYDKSIYFPDWFVAPRKLLVHEITHALQDQNFDTIRFGSSKYMFSDDIFAAAAFLEGHAMYAERGYQKSSEARRDSSSSDLTTSVPLLNEQCRMPDYLLRFGGDVYALGESFVSAVAASGGTEALYRMYASPPRSSLEILFPKLYLGKQIPPRQLPALPDSILISGRRATRVLSDTLGVYTMQSLLADRSARERFLDIAPEWRGDLVALYRQPKVGQSLVLWKSQWANEAAAQQWATLCHEQFGSSMAWQRSGATVVLSFLPR